MNQETVDLISSFLTQEPPHRTRGRPSIEESGLYTRQQIAQVYAESGSLRRTAAKLSISPTTVQKYLTGFTRPVGRPTQNQAWKVKPVSPVHAWFVANRDKVLPASPKGIAKLSGFTQQQILYYLRARKNGVFAFIGVHGDPFSQGVIHIDILNNRLPSIFVKSFTLTVNRYTLQLQYQCLLTTGAARTVTMPFHEYLEIIKRPRVRSTVSGEEEAPSTVTAPGV